jgi:hypothetical protein
MSEMESVGSQEEVRQDYRRLGRGRSMRMKLSESVDGAGLGGHTQWGKMRSQVWLWNGVARQWGPFPCLELNCR